MISVYGRESITVHVHAGAKSHGCASPQPSHPEGDTHSRGGVSSRIRLGQGENAAGGLVESHVMAEQIRRKRYENEQRCGI